MGKICTEMVAQPKQWATNWSRQNFEESEETETTRRASAQNWIKLFRLKIHPCYTKKNIVEKYTELFYESADGGEVGDCFVCFSPPVVSAPRHFVIATNN